MSESPLLDIVDKTTLTWVQKLSLVAIPPLRMHAGGDKRVVQRNRDIFIVTMLIASAALMGLFYYAETQCFRTLERVIAALALYRCLDIFITLIRTGIFLHFRGDVPLREQPTWRVQRILLGVLFNYAEVVNWFTIIYRQISLTSTNQFSDEITSLHQAFNLSFSTMATIGYGKYSPNALASEIFAFAQAGIGIILLVLVVGSILALLTPRPNEKADWTPSPQEAHVIAPLMTFSVLFVVFFWFFGVDLSLPI